MKEKNNFSDFLKGFQAQGKPPSTIDIFRDDLDEFASFFEKFIGEPFAPEKVTIENFFDCQRQLPLSEASTLKDVVRKSVLIPVYFDWEIEQGRIEENPATESKRNWWWPRDLWHEKYRWLDMEAYAALQRALEKDVEWSDYPGSKIKDKTLRNTTLVYLMVNTGLELDEALALELSDIQITEDEGSVAIQGDKQRTIPLNTETRQALQAWLDVRPRFLLEGYVFFPQNVHFDNMRPLSARAARQAIRELGYKAGLPDLTPRMLRETYFKSLIDQDVPLEKVAALLGESLDTVRNYAIPSQQDVVQTVAKLEIPQIKEHNDERN